MSRQIFCSSGDDARWAGSEEASDTVLGALGAVVHAAAQKTNNPINAGRNIDTPQALLNEIAGG
jgi:hypothetical protein